MPKKTYLKVGDRAFCDGCTLRLAATDDGERFVLKEIDESVYYEGEPVNWDENGFYIYESED